MPTYVYKTEDGRVLETHQSIHDEAWEFIVDDDGMQIPVHRVPQSVPANFKGSGWAR